MKCVIRNRDNPPDAAFYGGCGASLIAPPSYSTPSAVRTFAVMS